MLVIRVTFCLNYSIFQVVRINQVRFVTAYLKKKKKKRIHFILNFEVWIVKYITGTSGRQSLWKKQNHVQLLGRQKYS